MDGPVELRPIDTATKVAFGLVDRQRALRLELRRLRAELLKLRLERPVLFDQLIAVAAAGLVELVVSYLKRKDRPHG